MRTRKLAWPAISCSCLLGTTYATPSINFPISSQVPSVALRGQQYSFTFAQSTFKIPVTPVSYSLLNEPSWLCFDSESRNFFGNVTTDDTGPLTFTLTASDSGGSVALEVTLFVADQSGPQTRTPLLSQLESLAPASAPDSVLLHPLEPFTLDLSQDTFFNTIDSTNFYATSADNSPLPSWLQFDPYSLVFSGRSPPLVSPAARPQTYGIRLIASDIAGFAQAEANFQIVIGYHVLAFQTTLQTIEISSGLGFQSDALRQTLMLDGDLIDDKDLASVIAATPSWAVLDTEKILLTGTPTPNAKSQSVLVQAADVYGNTANTSINLLVSSSQSGLFRTIPSSVNASIGQHFQYSIAASAFTSAEVRIVADLSNASTWMTYDATSRTLSGWVPRSLRPGTVVITLNATLSTATEQEQIVVNIVESSTSVQSSRSLTGPETPTDHASSQSTSASDTKAINEKRRLAILLGVFIPLGCLIGVVSLILYCCWRRRKRKEKSNLASLTGFPRPGSCHEIEEAAPAQEYGSPIDAPRIDFPWAPDSLSASRERSSKVASNRHSTVADSDWGDYIIRDRPESATVAQRLSRGDSDTLGGLREAGDWTPFVRGSSNRLHCSRRRTPLRPSQSRVQRSSMSSRASKSLSTLSTISYGLPARLSGAGHGAGGPGLPHMTPVRRSWRNPVGTPPSHDGRSTPLDLNRFPEPPISQSEERDRRRESTAKPSIRLISSSSSHSGSLVDQRQRWVRDRARDRFGEGSTFSHTRSSRGRSCINGIESGAISPVWTQSPSSRVDSLSKRRNTPRAWSQSSKIGASTKLDHVPWNQSPDQHPIRRPSTLRRALSTVSSGRLNSVESKSESSWIDDLIEEEDREGHRRWVALDKPPQPSPVLSNISSSEGAGSEHGSWGKNSRAGGLGALRDNIQGGGQGVAMGERRWRLGGDQAKRPVSVDEGELQRSLGSQRGNLAFV